MCFHKSHLNGLDVNPCVTPREMIILKCVFLSALAFYAGKGYCRMQMAQPLHKISPKVYNTSLIRRPGNLLLTTLWVNQVNFALFPQNFFKVYFDFYALNMDRKLDSSSLFSPRYCLVQILMLHPQCNIFPVNGKTSLWIESLESFSMLKVQYLIDRLKEQSSKWTKRQNFFIFCFESFSLVFCHPVLYCS